MLLIPEAENAGEADKHRVSEGNEAKGAFEGLESITSEITRVNQVGGWGDYPPSNDRKPETAAGPDLRAVEASRDFPKPDRNGNASSPLPIPDTLRGSVSPHAEGRSAVSKTGEGETPSPSKQAAPSSNLTGTARPQSESHTASRPGPPSAGLEWKAWKGSIVPAWMGRYARTETLGRVRDFVGILTIEAGGRGVLVLRVEENGAVVGVMGREEKRGIRTPAGAQEWGRIALARLYRGVIGAGKRSMESEPIKTENWPAACLPGTAQTIAQGIRPEPLPMLASRSGRRAASGGAGMRQRSGAPGSARPRTPDHREAGAAPEARADASGLVSHCISARDETPQHGRNGSANPAKEAIRDYPEAAILAHSQAHYTLHILYDVMCINIANSILHACEQPVKEMSPSFWHMVDYQNCSQRPEDESGHFGVSSGFIAIRQQWEEFFHPQSCSQGKLRSWVAGTISADTQPVSPWRQ